MIPHQLVGFNSASLHGGICLADDIAPGKIVRAPLAPSVTLGGGGGRFVIGSAVLKLYWTNGLLIGVRRPEWACTGGGLTYLGGRIARRAFPNPTATKCCPSIGRLDAGLGVETASAAAREQR